MSGDLEARIVQAAREAVSVHVPPWATMGANNIERIYIESGWLDKRSDVHYAILGARAALAEIEREGVVVPREPTPEMCEAGEGFNIRCGCSACDLDAREKVAAGYRAMVAAAPTSHPQSADQTK